MFICKCGKEFSGSQSFNGHKSHCKIHQIETYGEEHYNKVQEKLKANTLKMNKAGVSKAKEDLRKNNGIWISEQHTCEKCGKVMTEKFGSGRFCSRACANARVHTIESRFKTSQSLLKNQNINHQGKIIVKDGIAYFEDRYCKTCGKLLGRKNTSGYCVNCIKSAPELFKQRSEASKKGVLNRKINGTQFNWQSRNIQSYPEKFWQDVLDNNQIDYKGPNVPIKKSDGKSNYFLDFLIEKDGIKIDLEIDGKQHKYPDRIESDKLRDEYLSSLGFKIYRIDWNEINSDSGKLKMKEKIDSFLLYLDGCDNW